jgi:RimJ/RimL family protein N-acetyltransferase
MDWIKHPIILQGKKITLCPLEENLFEELINSSQNEIIWTYMPVNGLDKKQLHTALEDALLLREKKEQYPFVVIETETKKIIGCTRFLKLNEEHKNLEIGWTWYLPEYWSKGYNEECKLLLLSYCFEVLHTIRVQITASDKNLRSRKAILRIGATFEGVLRNILIRRNEKKSAAYYSIIDEEWSNVKLKLIQLLESKYRQ